MKSIRDTHPTTPTSKGVTSSSSKIPSLTFARSASSHRRSLSASSPFEANLMKASHSNPGLRVNRASTPTTAAATTPATASSPTSPSTTFATGAPPSGAVHGRKSSLSGKGRAPNKKSVDPTSEDAGEARPRRVSSSAESLRRYVERAASPSDNRARAMQKKGTSQKASSPAPPLIRRSSGSSSSSASLSHSQNTTPESTSSSITAVRNSVLLRAGAPSSPTVQRDIDVTFPTSGSSPSLSPSGSLSNVSIQSGHSVRSIDFLKSSLRDTLALNGKGKAKATGNEGRDDDAEEARNRTVSSPPAVGRTHRSRRSVSFAVEDDTAEIRSPTALGSGNASGMGLGIRDEDQSRTAKDATLSDASHTSRATRQDPQTRPEHMTPSSLRQTSAASSPEQSFASESLKPGGSVFTYVNHNRPTTRSRRSSSSLHLAPPASSSNATPDSSAAVTPLGLVSPERLFQEYVMKVVNEVRNAYLPSESDRRDRRSDSQSQHTVQRNQRGAVGRSYKERNALSQVIEVLVGLWLAAIWVVIGRIFGLNSKKR